MSHCPLVVPCFPQLFQMLTRHAHALQYNTHFFVNPHGANGLPESHWVHPNEQERQKAPQNEKGQSYAPPSGPPPPMNGSPSTPGLGSSSSYNQQQQQQSSSYNDERNSGKKGGFLGKLLGGGNKHSSSHQQQQYRPQQQQMYGGGGYGQREYIFCLYRIYSKLSWNAEDLYFLCISVILQKATPSKWVVIPSNRACTDSNIPSRACTHNSSMEEDLVVVWVLVVVPH